MRSLPARFVPSNATEYLLPAIAGIATIGFVLLSASGFSVAGPAPSPPFISARYGGPYDFKSIAAVAVYGYAYKYADLDRPKIQFTIRKPAEIKSVIAGIDMNAAHALDGTTLGTEPDAYLYVRNATGRIHQYRVVMAWGYLIDGDDRKKLHKISDATAKLLRSRLKK